MWSIHKYIWLYSSSNCTTGSPCNSLVGQAYPSESCQVLTLTLWIPGQTLTAATSTASFVQNPSVLRQLVYSMFKLMHVSRESHTAHESYGHIEQAILNFLLKLCNHVESLKNYIVESVINYNHNGGVRIFVGLSWDLVSFQKFLAIISLPVV